MDLIDRQAAIDALGEEPEVWTGKDEYAQGLNNQWHYDRNAILKCPSAQPDLDEWCTDCKEYDQERHSCPRWNRVIRETLKDAQPEQRWIPCSERLPEKVYDRYWVCTDTGYQCQCRWTDDVYGLGSSGEWTWKIFDIPQYSHVVAWMQLPSPYQAERREDG